MPDPNPPYTSQLPKDDPGLPAHAINIPSDGPGNQPVNPFPPVDPPGLNRNISLVEEMQAIRFVLSLSSSDSQWQNKAAVLLEYILMYSHGMIDPADIPYPIPLKARNATRFTANKFRNRTLPSMQGLP